MTEEECDNIKESKPDTMPFPCGEIAGDFFYIELLLGLGLRCFSVVPTEILEIKSIIRSVSLAEAKTMARQALTMGTALEVEDFLEMRWRAKNPVLSDLTDPQIYGQVASGRKV